MRDDDAINEASVFLQIIFSIFRLVEDNLINHHRWDCSNSLKYKSAELTICKSRYIGASLMSVTD